MTIKSDSENTLYVIAECPASPGFGCVVVLKSHSTGKLLFFAPCCGIAWDEPPFGGRLDEIRSLEEVEPGSVTLPTSFDLRAAGLDLFIIRTEPLHRWDADIPVTYNR
jgi:hypothetical protein